MCFAKFRNPTVTSRISAGYMADIRHPDHGFRWQGVKKLTKSRATKRKEKYKEYAKRFSHHTESIQFNPSISACGRFKLCFTYTFLSFSSLKYYVALVLNQSKARFPHSKGPYLSFLCDIYL